MIELVEKVKMGFCKRKGFGGSSIFFIFLDLKVDGDFIFVL